MVFGVLRLRPPPCIPATWTLTQDQVWRNSKDFFACRLLLFVNLGPTCEIWKPVISDAQRFYPTSPLRDYTGTTGRRRRSHSACVRFKDARATEEDVRNAKTNLNQCHLLLSRIFRLSQEGTPCEEHTHEFFLHELAALFGATFVQISFQKSV